MVGTQTWTPLLWLTLALCGVAAVWSSLRSPVSLLVVLPGVAVCVMLLRDRGVEARERERLEQMVAALRNAPGGGSLQLEGGIHDLLVSARRLFVADYAEILVFPEEHGGP